MDIDDGREYDGGFHLRPREHVGHEFGEFGMAVDVFGVRACRGSDTAKCKVYGIDSALHDIV